MNVLTRRKAAKLALVITGKSAAYSHTTSSSRPLFCEDRSFPSVACNSKEATTKLSAETWEEQRSFFDKFGFIHFTKFIDEDTVQSIVKASIEVQNKWIKDSVKKINGVPIKCGLDLDGSAIVQRFAFINKHHSVFEEFLLDPGFKTVLDLAGPEARLGADENDGMVFNHYINGPKSKFSQMGWWTVFAMFSAVRK